MIRVSLLLVCAAATLRAQSFTGSILGTVNDATGAIVPAARIHVINTGTNARVEAVSDANGNYAAHLLPPGTYSIEATGSGFKKFVREGITLQVQQQAQVAVVLAVGEVTETIVVSADATQLETSSSTIGKVVDNRRIVNLPLNTRNVYSLVFLTPGVSGSVGNNYGDMRYSVNGARARQMDTLIDGVSASHATVTGFSGISVFPSVDAIEEFKVMGAN
ncbi:MAG: carboxypeptidase regulatory-like domain-containing protein, partial [Acidobacteria bacterium]|nr:carboxypeptidase regulatory-like domain-containing protein [Acidobacteriota bacterium]